MIMRTLRRPLALVAGLCLAVGLAACGSDNDDSNSSTSNDNGSNSATAPESYYPHTQTTSYGDVTIEEQPERVVALNANIADEMMSLGITPVAVASNIDELDQFYPWVDNRIKEVAVEGLVTSQSPDFEKIAEVNPDLIIGEPANFPDKSDWEKSSAIAPTVFTKLTQGSIDWKESLRTTAESLGLTGKSVDISSSIETQYRNKANGLENVTYNYFGIGDDKIGFVGGNGIDLLGIKPASSQKPGETISTERMGQLDGDVLFIFMPSKEQRDNLQNNPLFKRLPAVANGNIKFVENAEATAAAGVGPSALLWFLDRITPTIEKLK